ncbi:MAG TPA: hypothetical protein VJ044_01305, partial [Candidatus Hodarchaeales archaeon]|nr:hypothetical protein [Candidatus Hodarchaeales archaeon]
GPIPGPAPQAPAPQPPQIATSSQRVGGVPITSRPTQVPASPVPPGRPASPSATIQKAEIVESVTIDVDQDLGILPEDLKRDNRKLLLQICPVLIDARPYVSGEASPTLKYSPSVQILPIQDQTVRFLVLVGTQRIHDYMRALADLEARVKGHVALELGGVMFKASQENFYNAFKGIIWSLFIEYAYQVEKQLRPRTEIFKIPNEGSVCIIPDGLTPNRRKQLPKKIVDVIEETELIQQLESENPVTIAKSIDALLQKTLSILKTGKGIGIVPRKGKNEVPELTEFLLILSEVTGIGWSRW